MDIQAQQDYLGALRALKEKRRRERLLIILACLIGFLIASSLDLFEEVYTFVHDHESWELDELFLLSFFVSIGLIAYISRRNLELVHVNSLIEHYATTDPLTGLLNRGQMGAMLEHELAVAERYSCPLSLVWIDLDNFKRVNDELGHVCGDRILRKMAGLLSANLRNSDLLGRMGGDEFLLVLSNTDLEVARQVAERQLELIRAVEITELCRVAPVQLHHLTASIGYCQYRPGESMESLLHRLDEAMYQSKRAGKDGLTLAAEGLPSHA